MTWLKDSSTKQQVIKLKRHISAIIGQNDSRNDTRISKEAHQKGEYDTEINAKEAHHSKDTGLPRWQSVCLNFDPRAKKGHPMIGND
ncbi:hypothetical protein Tco_0545563 [Tanacetum coccineum]